MPVPVARSYECGGGCQSRRMVSVVGGGDWSGRALGRQNRSEENSDGVLHIFMTLVSSWAVAANEKEDN